MLHILIHIYSDNPLFKPFCSLIYILCFTDLARKKISVFWCTFLKCKTRKRLNWIFFFFFKEKRMAQQNARWRWDGGCLLVTSVGPLEPWDSGEQAGKFCAKMRRIFEIFFLPSVFLSGAARSQGAAQSWETQFLIFLLLPGLSCLQTGNGIKQKQRGRAGTPQTPKREGKE